LERPQGLVQEQVPALEPEQELVRLLALEPAL
jgi:hypothetical protein